MREIKLTTFQLKSSQAYPGADADSDHVPVIAKSKLSLKRSEKSRTKPRYEFSKLISNPDMKRNFQAEVLQNIPTEPLTNKHSKAVSETIQTAAANNISTVEKSNIHRFGSTRNLKICLQIDEFQNPTRRNID